MEEALIQYRNVEIHQQELCVLSDVNLELHKGEFVYLIGKVGSGKTSLLKTLYGELDVVAGEARVLGYDMRSIKRKHIPQLRRKLGIVFQDFQLLTDRTVYNNLEFVLRATGWKDRREIKERIEEVLDLVGMSNKGYKIPNELSGGQKQRVSLAGVMVDDVKVLLFDEPLANLDPAAGRATIELIDEIQEKTGAAVLIIEHRLEDVLWRHVDRVVLMQDGAIVADLPPGELLCGNFLMERGIREPLYLTALRYALVPVTPEICPEHPDTLKLTDAQKQQVKNWVLEQQEEVKEQQPGTELLKVEHLSFSYGEGRKNLEDISFTIYPGEMVSIVGKNGAGKSTLAKLICGFEHPQEGKIFFQGRDLASDTIKERASFIGYVMQNPNQMISKPMIWDEVEMALLQTGMTPEERKERVEETLKICGLYPFRKWPVSALSFGQKKRVTIASILVQRPQVIILDEPTAGQDYHHYTEIMEFLKELNEQGFTILMITHDMHLMLEYTKRAIVFCKGKLLADTTSAHVLNDPELVKRASLKETSLYTLSLKCGVEPPQRLTERFIAQEEHTQEKKEVPAHG